MNIRMTLVIALLNVILVGTMPSLVQAGTGDPGAQPFQKPVTSRSVPMKPERWDIQARHFQFEEYKGKQALLLEEGLALVKGLGDFTNGVIEFDLAIPEERGFSGAVWRVQDRKNYEEFYLRHHQSGNEDANQYSPVFNGLAGWQLYYSGDGFGFPSVYAFGEWMHVKIVVQGEELEVYLEDMETPIVYVPRQRRPVEGGGLGLNNQTGAPARFAEFTWRPMDTPPMKRQAKESAPPNVRLSEIARVMPGMGGARAPGTVMNWEVSEAVGYEVLGKLEELHNLPLKWTRVEPDETGLLDLSKAPGVAERLEKDGRVLVLCRTRIHSNKQQVKRMELGFSDEVLFFLNGEPVYEGSDRCSQALICPASVATATARGITASWARWAITTPCAFL